MATLLIDNIPDDVMESITRSAQAKGRTVAEEAADRLRERVVLGEPIVNDEIPAPYDLHPTTGERVPARDGGVLRLETWFDELRGIE